MNFLRKIKSWCPQPQDRLTTKLKNYSKPTGIVIAATLILVISFSLILTQYALTQTVPQPPIIKTPTENSQTLPQASPTQLTQTPQPTSQPTVAPTPDTPTITPQPEPTTPRSTIAYCEMGRTYDANSDVTKIQIRIVIKSQGITDGTYSIYISNFYLSEYGVTIPNQINKGVTSNVPLTTISSVLTEPTFEIAGNYTSSGYALSYDNFPIEAAWSKQQSISLV